MRIEILEEIKNNFLMVDEAQMQMLVDKIAKARHIILHGKGRVGLMMKAFAIRLSQLGLYARIIGDITAPPIQEGDLLLVGNTSGFPSSSSAFYDIARRNRAASVCITANPNGPVKDMADDLVVIYGRTMNAGPNMVSLQPMCTTVEHVLLLVLDYIVLLLQKKLSQSEQTMRSRQANIL
ncbi:MAG: SIS domain-containing protein [Christensenellales bacterium]